MPSSLLTVTFDDAGSLDSARLEFLFEGQNPLRFDFEPGPFDGLEEICVKVLEILTAVRKV